MTQSNNLYRWPEINEESLTAILKKVSLIDLSECDFQYKDEDAIQMLIAFKGDCIIDAIQYKSTIFWMMNNDGSFQPLNPMWSALEPLPIPSSIEEEARKYADAEDDALYGVRGDYHGIIINAVKYGYSIAGSQLRPNTSRLREALERIANPLRHLQEEAKELGANLDGQMAIQLSNDASYLKQIASEALNTSGEEKQDEWIDVVDSSPNESGLVLGLMKDTQDIYVCFYRKGRNLFEVYGAGRDPITDMKVTHWMPLPKPPIHK